MRIAVVGAAGQLGRELCRLLPAADTIQLTRAEADLHDTAVVRARLDAARPDVVVNCAADNRVDAAESDARGAIAVNALGVAALARHCRDHDALLVHVSTDYVFDGRATRPYTEDAAPNPQGAYARTKLAGELLAQALAPRHAILRVAGLYAEGGSRGKGGNFVDKVLAQARAGKPLRIVSDQVTAPTWARDVAAAMVRLVPRIAAGAAPHGVYHVTNAGACSWYEFAQAALEIAGLRAEITPIRTEELGAPAPRPAYSVLANTRLAAAGLPPLRLWREALAAYLLA